MYNQTEDCLLWHAKNLKPKASPSRAWKILADGGSVNFNDLKAHCASELPSSSLSHRGYKQSITR